MLIKTLPLGLLETNCYLVASGPNANAAVIDPVDDAAAILAAAKADHLRITHILLTHGHFDHVMALNDLKQQTNATIGVHSADAAMIESATGCLADQIGVSYTPAKADFLINHGEIIHVGSLEFTALHTPGHTPGGMSFYAPGANGEPGAVFTGDALFSGAIGRTDLPGGDTSILMDAIVQKLFTLPDETRVYPGHGPASTVAHERRHNPFFI